MNPEQVRQELAVRHAPKLGQLPEPAAAAAVREDDLYKSISSSYLQLRRGLAVIAFAFPLLLWIGGGIDHLQASISAYYHYDPAGPARYGAGTMRNVFVGILWAIGSFLYFYKGYSKTEDIALDLAGAAALAVSLFPMDWPVQLGVARTWTGTFHYASAILFFVTIAYVCVFRSGDTLKMMHDAVTRRRFKRTYGVMGMLMITAPLAVLLLHLLSGSPERNFLVLGVEVAGIWVFAAFWFVKSREIAIIERQ